MADPDPKPKLRVVDDVGNPVDEVVRLGGKKGPQGAGPVLSASPQPPPVELPARLEGAAREHFEGRSVEPGIDTILDKKAVEENVEHPWGDSRRRLSGIPYGWFILIALVLAGAGIWSLQAVRKGEARIEASHETIREKIEADEKNEAEARELVDTVEETVREYLAADTIGAILPLVRQPERVRPLIEKTWQTRPKTPLKFKRMAMFQPAYLDGRPFWVVRAEVEDGESQNLLLEQTGENEVKVDWETHICYQPMNWDDFIAEHSAEKSRDFRLWAVRDNLYSHEFSDPDKWLCFRLTTKDSAQHLFGYAAAGSDTAKTLEEYCARSPNRMATVILGIRFLPGSKSPRGVEIEKVVTPRWVYLEAPPADAP